MQIIRMTPSILYPFSHRMFIFLILIPSFITSQISRVQLLYVDFEYL